jgi:hypothetical protein
VVISYCAGTRTLNEERILKATKEKRQVTYKGKPIRIKADFTTQTVNVMERHNSGYDQKT